MSRPHCTLCIVFPVSLAVASLSFASCRSGTIYDRTYSPKKSYYKAPAEQKDIVSAEALLGPTTGSNPTPGATTPTSANPPPAPEMVPGLPPAGLPPMTEPAPPPAIPPQ